MVHLRESSKQRLGLGVCLKKLRVLNIDLSPRKNASNRLSIRGGREGGKEIYIHQAGPHTTLIDPKPQTHECTHGPLKSAQSSPPAGFPTQSNPRQPIAHWKRARKPANLGPLCQKTRLTNPSPNPHGSQLISIKQTIRCKSPVKLFTSAGRRQWGGGQSYHPKAEGMGKGALGKGGKADR